MNNGLKPTQGYRKPCFSFLAWLSIAVLTACQDSAVESDGVATEHASASAVTKKKNHQLANTLALADQGDFEEATRGFIARSEQVIGDDQTPIWDMNSYGFLDGDAPDSVNPSLWRQAQLNNIHGLFEATAGIYQLRGFDLANMTIIEGDKGWIVVDPLTTSETSAAALAFAREHLGDKPVVAVIFTYSHIDHFGGVLGVVSADAVANGSVKIIAPKGFLEEATSENVMVGTTMGRRAMYMYGSQLERSAYGHVDSGLGKSPAFGKNAILAATDIVSCTGQTMTIDGVTLVFQNAAGSEAPAELTFYLPKQRAFCGAEVVSRNMHNLYTLRGAKVRDALKWSHYIDEAISLFPEKDVYFASHHWPMWGSDKIAEFLKKQRDTYKYIHDQTLRLAGQGLTPKEIAEELALPESISQSFANRGYYGTTKHNAKAVYQRYFGWFDGNPANLDPLPPEAAAKRYVAMMGGATSMMAVLEEDYKRGDYRWVAQALNHLVFAEPSNNEAKELLAKAYEQLGYQAESAPWRDVYLTGALELRQGAPEQGIVLSNAIELLRMTLLPRFFDLMATMLNGPKADGKKLLINFSFTDLNESYVIEVDNAVLHHRLADEHPDANATLRLTHDIFLKLLLKQAGLKDTVFSDDVEFEGSQLDFLQFLSLLDPPKESFNIVVP